MEGLAHVLANELRGRNLTVNAVAPGPTEGIANVVSFLAGPDGEWVNGQVLRINGGFI